MRARLRRLTALEAIAVVLAVVTAATFVSPGHFRPRGHGRATAEADVDAIGAALETYRYDTGHYPTTGQGLAALVRLPATPPRPWNWRGPYVLRPVPNDPWGAPYVYRRVEAPSEGYALSSYGADGRPGGRGDAADVTARR